MYLAIYVGITKNIVIHALGCGTRVVSSNIIQQIWFLLIRVTAQPSLAGPVTCCLDAQSVRRPPLWHSVIRVVGAGTLPFAVPRLRSSVHDNVHRYDDIHSEAVHAGADEVCQGFDSDGLALVLLLLSLGSRWGLVLML